MKRIILTTSLSIFFAVTVSAMERYELMRDACTYGTLKNVESIVKSNSNKVNEQDRDGFTGLQLACEKNRTEIALFLLNSGAKPNIHQANPIDTPLSYAVKHKNETLVIKLLQAGAQQTFTDWLGNNISIINLSQSEKITRLLKEYK